MHDGSLVIARPTDSDELLLLFHGVGASAQDLVPLGEALARARPRATVVSVEAPHPSALGRGREWFSVVGVTEENRPGRIASAMPLFLGAISRWHRGLKSSESSNGNQPGARRTLVFANGEVLHEDLDAWDADKHEYQYRMSEANVKALPASSYSAILRVSAAEQGTRVEWKSRAYRGDTGNEPSESLSDEAVTQALQQFFATGLAELKAKAEAAP